MINPTREQVATALFSLVNTAPMQALFSTISRRPVLFNAAPSKPALYMGSPTENYVYQDGPTFPPMIGLDFQVFIYINSGLDPSDIPDILMNNLIDALEAAIAPVPPIPGAKQTLGGIVDHAYIEGTVHRAPGWLDGEGMALLTIKVLVPSSG